MGKNYTSITSDCNCPECGNCLQLNLKPERTDTPKLQMHHKYFFECKTANGCTYESRIYCGPTVELDGFNDNRDAREYSREKAIEAAHSQVEEIAKNLN